MSGGKTGSDSASEKSSSAVVLKGGEAVLGLGGSVGPLVGTPEGGRDLPGEILVRGDLSSRDETSLEEANGRRV
jgi:hypothetical protein